MVEINLQCNNLSQTHSSVFFRLKIVLQVEHILGGSAEPSLAEIHQEMSELLDKQVNAQNRKLPGFTQAPASPRKKCVMKMKETNKEKNDACIKILLMEGGNL